MKFHIRLLVIKLLINDVIPMLKDASEAHKHEKWVPTTKFRGNW